MKKTIDLDFSDTLETCLRFSRVQVRALSEIIEKGVDKEYERIIEIIMKADSEDVAEQQMTEEFVISRATARMILNSPLKCNIVCEAQDYLEYYREAAEKLSAILRKNPEK